MNPEDQNYDNNKENNDNELNMNNNNAHDDYSPRVYKYVENPSSVNANHDNVDTQSIPVVNDVFHNNPEGSPEDGLKSTYNQENNGFISHNFDNSFNNFDNSQFNDNYDHNYSQPRRKEKSKGFPIVIGLALAAVIGGASGYLASEYNSDEGSNSFTSSTGSVSKSSGIIEEPSVWGETIDSAANSVASLTIYKEDGNGGFGSGVIISKDGYVLTNHHVVEGTKKISVSLKNGSIYEAKVVGSDPTTDLAVIALKNAPKDLPFVSFADSSKVKSGDSILAIGNPLGLDQTSTTGIVSAVNRPVTSSQGSDNGGDSVYTNAIQIDAAINPGNSGGPLFNSNGDVIGITSSIATVPGGLNTGSAGSIGLGFAIPSNQAAKVSDALIKDGEAHHGLLGAKIQTGEAKIDEMKKSGAKIIEATDNGPAKEAGIKKNDVIIGIDDKVVSSSESLTAFVREYLPKDKVEIEYVRDGKIHKTNVKLGELVSNVQPDSNPNPNPQPNPQPLPENPKQPKKDN